MRKKKFVSIRNEVRDARHGEEGTQEEDYTASVHYLASQYLADSSLSTDVSQYDFGGSATASVSHVCSIYCNLRNNLGSSER